MVSVALISKDININRGSYRIWINDLHNYFKQININSEINPQDINNYDILIYDKYDNQNWDFLKECKFNNKIIGIINPNCDLKNILEKVNFIIVGSVEEKESIIKYNRNCFIFPLIENLYLNIIKKNHIKKKILKIGYHGNEYHLNHLHLGLKKALERIYRKYNNIELVVISHSNINKYWKLGIPDIPIKIIKWDINTIIDEIQNIDIGIVPNISEINHLSNLKENMDMGEYISDIQIRFKNKSNIGRELVFFQLGIPVIADITPSNMHILSNPDNGFAVFTEDGWYCALEKLLDEKERNFISNNAYNEYKRLYDPIDWADKLYKNILKIYTTSNVYLNNIERSFSKINNSLNKNSLNNNLILVTGCAGFIGFHTCEELLKKKYNIIGIDNMNNYYDMSVNSKLTKETKKKYDNLDILKKYDNFLFYNDDICTTKLISIYKPHKICHLASMAGVRYSIQNPDIYFHVNVKGFIHLLEEARKNNIINIVYASSSSVYGLNTKVPFNENDIIDKVNSPYAISKQCMENIAKMYKQLYKMNVIGLRFFTVYGPRCRPDMAAYKFMNSIKKGEIINVYGSGETYRDYTYIDDIVKGIINTLDRCFKLKNTIFNLGNSNPITLNNFIKIIEETIGKKAQINIIKDQVGDVPHTYADITLAANELDFNPIIDIKEGISKMFKWYVNSCPI